MKSFCLYFCIFEDSSDLENFFCFCFLDDLLRLHFLLDVSIFTTIDDEKKEINSSSIFERFYLKLRRKFWEFINTVDSR